VSAGFREFDTPDNGHNGDMGYPGPIPYAGGGGDSLFQIAWRGKWLIVLAVLLGLGGAYAYLRRLPAEYTSTSRILVSVPDARLKSDVPLPVVSRPNLATQASMITSPVIVSAALSDPNVLALSADLGGNLQDLTRKLSVRVGKDDIISVSASTSNPKGAAVIVNTVVHAYRDWHDRNRETSTAQFLHSLNKELDRLSQELLAKRREMTRFEEKNPGVVEGRRGGLVSETVDLLKQQLLAARLQLIQLNSFRHRLNVLEPDPNKIQDPNKFRQYVYGQQNALGITVEDSEWTRATEELYKIRLQLEQLAAGGPVQKSQITLLQNREKRLVQRNAELDKEFVRKYLDLASVMVEDAVAREQELTKTYGQEAAKIQGLGQENAQYAQLVAECEILGRQCSSLSEQISKVPPDSGQAGVSVYVLEKAMPAAAPSSPMVRILGIGLVLGLMVGGGLALLRDWRDQRVRSAEEIVTLLGVPILGAVPTLRRRVLPQRGPQVRLAWHSQEFEAYRAIRTALLFGPGCGKTKTLLITSPGQLEGKTTLVSHLGVALAHAGQKTLIVDADLRKPEPHRIFANGSPGKGLTEVLAGGVSLDEAIRPTKIGGLDVLEGGDSVANPSELLGSDACGSLFTRLQDKYDCILIDSPPVGICTDAQVLAARCGLTLLVLRAQKSSRGATQRARDALSTVSARVVGVVVNDVPKRDTRYSHLGYGAYAYGGSNGRQMARKELPDEGNSRPVAENGRPTNADQPPPEKKNGRRRASNSLSAQAATPSESRTSPNGKKNGRKKAVADEPPANTEAQPENGPVTPQPNARETAPIAPVANPGVQPQAGAAASPMENHGQTQEQPPTDTGPRLGKEDPAGKWKRWLKGGR
jgi:succinoglycan biosynthesis transport protein ExoP